MLRHLANCVLPELSLEAMASRQKCVACSLHAPYQPDDVTMSRTNVSTVWEHGITSNFDINTMCRN